VPRERMLEVAEHYYHFNGVSPINQQNRDLIANLEKEFREHNVHLPIYWGNRNWHPLLADTLRDMAAKGVKKALAFFTSAFSSYSGCRQYRENIAVAQREVGPQAPEIEKLRCFFNHPGFIETMADRVRHAVYQLPSEGRAQAQIYFTAHSIPNSMAATCAYEAQLNEACRLVGEAVQLPWRLVFQSRSGPPQQPWLEPDVCAALREHAVQHKEQPVVVCPIGFISDHMEVLFDLDEEAAHVCRELGVTMLRAKTAGTHPRFIRMIRELVEERMAEHPQRLVVGNLPPSHDVCPVDCCVYEPRRN
jgi:protoporphyrin/coproporphyrin ferrochelatase